MPFTTIKQQEINSAMEKLNNQLRKRFRYQTPKQTFLIQALLFVVESAFA